MHNLLIGGYIMEIDRYYGNILMCCKSNEKASKFGELWSPPSNNIDLEEGQRSRSLLGANWKGLSQGSCMPNVNALSLILQKIWARLKFLWWTDRQTNEIYCLLLSRKAGDNKIPGCLSSLMFNLVYITVYSFEFTQSETDPTGLEFANSPIFLHNPLYTS